MNGASRIAGERLLSKSGVRREANKDLAGAF
jgi:hypothetical protein